MVCPALPEAEGRQHPGPSGASLDERQEPAAPHGDAGVGRPAVQGRIGSVSALRGRQGSGADPRTDEGDVERQEQLGDEEQDEGSGVEPQPGSTQFALEKDLQLYLANNLAIIEPGLSLFVDDDIKGMEYPAGGGRRIDILAVDNEGGFVVLELKVEKGYDRVVGQLLRYMNWVRKELAEPGQRVRGVIVCRTMSEDLRLACASIPDVELFEYKLSVTVSKVLALQFPMRGE